MVPIQKIIHQDRRAILTDQDRHAIHFIIGLHTDHHGVRIIMDRQEMTIKTILLIFICFLFSKPFFAQEKKEPIIMGFHLVVDNHLLEINKKYVSETKDSLEISVF